MQHGQSETLGSAIPLITGLIMAKQGTEEELNIKRRARRRLIGAIALALAVVVILPMVLDSEPKPGGQDIELRIPDAEKAGDFVPGIAPSAVSELTSLDEPAVTPPSDAASAVEAPDVPVAVSSVKPVVAPVVVQKPVVAAKPVEAKAALPAVDRFVVQIGAFSNAATATSEAGKLKVWGFQAYTEQISGTTRVRVGPYADRSKAEEVRQLLEKRGMHPVITAVNGQGK